MNFKTIVSVSLVSALLSSCSMIPTYTKPQVETPARWTMETKNADGTEIPEQWWTLFKDDNLNEIVDQARRKNLDLKMGIERVNQSRAALKIAGANLLPSADASLSANKTHTNPATGNTTTTTGLSGGLSIAYDLDLFGANDATRQAAIANFKASEYTQKALELSTYSDLTEVYFNLLLNRDRISLATDNLKNAKKILQITEARAKAGVGSDLEIAQQKVVVANSEATLSSLTQTIKTYITAYALLLGEAPHDLGLSRGSLEYLTIPTIAEGQPSTLLERRPDIAIAEQNLIAANANIGVARAAFFPSITLGLTATATGSGLSDPLGTAIGIATGLTAPIFEGGRLEGGVEQANAKQRELVASYQKIVLNAFGEVENALSAVKTSAERVGSLKIAMDQSHRAYEISAKQYQVGTIDYATLLNTQTSFINARDAYAQAVKSRLSASLDLMKALGGGWKS